MTRLFVPVILAALAVPAATSVQNPPPAQAERPPAPPLGPNRWRIDGNHSAAHFSVRHLMVSTVRGELGRISGTIAYDGKDVRSIKADVSIDVKEINTRNSRRDNHLRSADFFDVANHPTITFRSKRVEPAGEGRFTLMGDLTIRGNTREVALDVEGPSPMVKTARGGVVTGASATTKIKRLEYGLEWNNMVEAGPVVGDEVTITIDIEANRPSPPGTAALQ